MTALEIIRVVGTEFRGIRDSDLTVWIEICRPLVSRKQFGPLFERALAFLVCHKLKMAGYGDSPLGELGKPGTGFGLGSVSEGGSSVSFGNSQATNMETDAEYGLTVYGTQFLQLRRMAVIPIHCSGEWEWPPPPKPRHHHHHHRKDDDDAEGEGEGEDEQQSVPSVPLFPARPQLPIAGEDRLGAVKVKPGAGLKVDIDGSLRVDLETILADAEGEEP